MLSARFDVNQGLSIGSMLVLMLCAAACGLLIAITAMLTGQCSKGFAASLVTLPVVVQAVILMVNGNVGTGVAVLGAFSLVRFRSVPGTAKEITTLFLAMGAGLIAGMGYLGYAVLFTVVMCAVFLLYNALDFGARRNAASYKTLAVTIPEDLDYTGVFDDIFAEYTAAHDLVSVKTTNMGSMFRLTYQVTLRDAAREKEMLDKIRCRNGNLEILISTQDTTVAEL